MKFLIQIFEDELAWQNPTEADWAAAWKAHTTFASQVPELGGTLLDGNALDPAGTAVTIRKGVVTDGPFIELKEALGGYYLIEAPSREVAIAIASACPAGAGAVELRQISDLPEA